MRYRISVFPTRWMAGIIIAFSGFVAVLPQPLSVAVWSPFNINETVYPLMVAAATLYCRNF